MKKYEHENYSNSSYCYYYSISSFFFKKDFDLYYKKLKLMFNSLYTNI